ncbi:MAG: ferritin-like domain-containing protein [Gallionella sp.]
MLPPPIQPIELRLAALFWLAECDAARKAAGVRGLAQAWLSGQIELDAKAAITSQQPIPGHPGKPELVAPRLVKRRSMITPEGRAILIHALAHIEFNAINLALDAIWRFPGMPAAYYADWLQVAEEEALHFSLLAEHLQGLGCAYGDFPAHNSLWEMAAKTQHDILARIALVPRTMEARGLDATPPVRAKLAQAGDMKAAVILDIILRDEIGHVAIGNRWYSYLCEQRGLEPIANYARLAAEYAAPVLRGPFNLEARRAAGFSDAELAALAGY